MSIATKLTNPSLSINSDLTEKSGEVLAHEQKLLDAEIEKVKSQSTVRKQDENTRVFNLRQIEMTTKIKELEVKKMRTENELNKLMLLKNSTLHEDIKKATIYLLNETKKIAPLEQNLTIGMNKISNLKNEMQLIFEASLNERMRNSKALEDQTKDLNDIGALIKNTMEKLENSYDKIGHELEKLMQEKIELVKKNLQIKEEIIVKETIAKDLTKKQDKVAALESTIKNFEEKILELTLEKQKFDHLAQDFQILNDQFIDIKRSIEIAQSERNETLHNTSRMELALQQLEDQVKTKKEGLALLEKEFCDSRKRVETIKYEEIDLMKHYQGELNSLNKIKAENAQVEALKKSTQEQQKEAECVFQEKKDIFKREYALMEREYQAKDSELESALQVKKSNWDEEFKTFCENRKNELQQNLDQMNNEDLTKIKERRSEFLKEVLGIMKNQFKQEGFLSSDERAENVRMQTEAAFDQFFGKTNRWKL